MEGREVGLQWMPRAFLSALQFGCAAGMCGSRSRDVDGSPPFQVVHSEMAMKRPQAERAAPGMRAPEPSAPEFELPKSEQAAPKSEQAVPEKAPGSDLSVPVGGACWYDVHSGRPDTLRSYSEAPCPCDRAADSDSEISSAGSYAEEMDKAHDELIKYVNKESKVFKKSTSDADQATAERLKAMASVHFSTKSLAHGTGTELKRSKSRAVGEAPKPPPAAAARQRAAAVDEEDEKSEDEDDPRFVDKQFEKEGVVEKIIYLRKVMDSGNMGPPKGPEAWKMDKSGMVQSEAEMQEAVGNYQTLMKRKLDRLGEATPSLKGTSDPSLAVCDAISRYHGACTRLGVVYAEPDSMHVEGAGDLSNAQRQRLERWQQVLSGQNSTHTRWWVQHQNQSGQSPGNLAQTSSSVSQAQA